MPAWFYKSVMVFSIVGGAAVLVLATAVGLKTEKRIDLAEAAIQSFCQRQENGLETKVNDPDHFELRAAMKYRFLDQATLKLCLGSEMPVDETEAQMCWVAKGDNACYAPLARDLLDLYRKRIK